MTFLRRLLRFSTAFCLFVITIAAKAQQANGTSPVNLRCEWLTDPVGIDASAVRLSWRLEDSRPGARQSAYSISVSADSASLRENKNLSWTSGKTDSDDELITYSGPALEPFTRYYWTVTVWDKDGNPGRPSPPAFFETGMMNQKNWKGSWISDTRDIKVKPAAYFRKTFLPLRTVKSARIYVAAAGLYELYLNGKRVGDHRLDPMYTRFDRRNLYVTYDVTHLIQNDSNALGVLLGNGWYNLSSTAVWYFDQAPWRARPAFCLDLRITYTDGSTETIGSGRDWKTSLSSVTFNSIYTGEHTDARLQQPGWNKSGFNDSAWKESMLRAAPSQNIVAQAMVPVRETRKISPVSLNRLNDTTWVYNLGENISGVSELTVSGPAGTTLRLKHGERLYPDGRVDLSNISVHYRPTDESDPFQTDIYTLAGKGRETFKPVFNYKGFQYVEITCSDKSIVLSTADLTGFFMHSDVPVAGQVEASDPVLQKIWKATNQSYLSNLFGYPTDCPQREKNGWTGDAHIASETGLYNFDGITVYEKWLADHRDEQQPNGVLPSIIPTDGWGYEWGNGPDWTSTIAIIPWNLWLFYGDVKPLATNYENLKRYVDHITSISPEGLTSWGLGDWVPVTKIPAVELTSSVYYFTDANILSKAAALLGKTEDQKIYSTLAGKIRTAFNKKYFHPQSASYGTGMQTELAMPLYWKMVPDSMIKNVAASLANRVKLDSNHLNVGLLGTKAILNALSENGYAGLAYTIAARKTYPSWGWWIVNGATTLFENWPIDAKSDISMNHIMFGEIGAWMYKGLGGIFPDADKPGFRHVLLRPHIVKTLAAFQASHDAPAGKIRSGWATIKGKIYYTAVIPANCTATLELQNPEDGKRSRELIAGSYRIAVRPE